MPNPTIVSVTPVPNATDVVLGSSIVITFSEPIDTDSYNNATFVLTGPNLSTIVTDQQLIEYNPKPAQGRGYILGSFNFSTKTYQPWAPFTVYALNAQVVDSNGNVQTVVEPGMSSPYAPAWLTTPGASTVDNNIPQWQADQAVSFGKYIVDPNQNLQKCTVSVGGTTGSVPPVWNKTLNGVTFDGSVTWTAVQVPVDGGPIWMNGGPANNGQTVATFTPAKPMLPGTIYTVLVVGSDSTLANTYVHDLSGNPLLSSYQWSFTTGTLNLSVPPTQNPIPPPKTYLQPSQVIVVPRPPVGVDDPSVSSVTTIELIFPAPVDINSFDPSQLLVGVEPIMNDPDVMVNYGANATYVVQGNKIIVTVTGV